MIRVALPAHLRTLARLTDGELTVDAPQPTVGAVLDAIEHDYPMLRGTIRAHGGGKRRPFIRFYALGVDFSNEPQDTPLPNEVASGAEPLRIVGAIAGG